MWDSKWTEYNDNFLPRTARELHIQSIESNLNRVQRRFLQSNLIQLNDKSDYTVAIWHQSNIHEWTVGKSQYMCMHTNPKYIENFSYVSFHFIFLSIAFIIVIAQVRRNVHVDPEFRAIMLKMHAQNSSPIHGNNFPRTLNIDPDWMSFADTNHFNTQLNNTDLFSFLYAFLLLVFTPMCTFLTKWLLMIIVSLSHNIWEEVSNVTSLMWNDDTDDINSSIVNHNNPNSKLFFFYYSRWKSGSIRDNDNEAVMWLTMTSRVCLTQFKIWSRRAIF